MSSDCQIEFITSSNAVRYPETAKLFAAAFKYPEKNIFVDTHLYYSGIDAFYDQFYDIPEYIKYAMIIGHNPYITNFVNHFIDNKINDLPTSGLISLNFRIN